MAPLEVVSRNARPRHAAIVRPPCRRFEAASVQHRRIAADRSSRRRHAGRHRALAATTRRDRSIGKCRHCARLAAPMRRDTSGADPRVDRKAVRAVHAFGQVHLFPGLGAIGRAVERAVEIVADLAAFAAARDDEIKRAVARRRQPPRERLVRRKPVVLQRPTLAAIVGTEDAAAEAGDVTGVRRRAGCASRRSAAFRSSSAARSCRRRRCGQRRRDNRSGELRRHILGRGRSCVPLIAAHMRPFTLGSNSTQYVVLTHSRGTPLVVALRQPLPPLSLDEQARYPCS